MSEMFSEYFLLFINQVNLADNTSEHLRRILNLGLVMEYFNGDWLNQVDIQISNTLYYSSVLDQCIPVVSKIHYVPEMNKKHISRLSVKPYSVKHASALLYSECTHTTTFLCLSQ